MPDWTSQEEIVRDTDAFSKLQHALSGVFLWEFVISFDFEWSFITGKKKLTWPMIPYFGGRYICLFTIIGMLVSLDMTSEVNCQALYTFLAFGGQAMIAFASINLAIRTMALWFQSPYVVVPLCILLAGQWAVLMQGVVIKAYWDPAQGCVASATKSSILTATFIYSICIDSIVFLLSAWKLALPRYTRTRLMDLMFKDGLVYFLLASLANIPAAVFISLQLNPVMNIIFCIPAAMMSTILASRAVRRLSNFTKTSPSVYITAQNSGRSFHQSDGESCGSISFAAGRARAQGVHIQMDTYTVAEQLSDVSAKPLKLDPESLEGTRIR